MPTPTPISLISCVEVVPSGTTSPTLPPPPETFQSQSLWRPQGARGVFGGQVIAQALCSASKTIPDKFGLHSQHCYFLLPADASIPINYQVEILRDGKSYANRLVKAVQRGKSVFILLASYTIPGVDVPPLKSDGMLPFSFIPTLPAPASAPTPASTTSKHPRAKDGAALSHSLRFALGPSGSGVQDPNSKAAQVKDRSEKLSGFVPHFQLPFPDDLLPFDQCQEEEQRWRKILNTKGGYKDDHRRSVEEYVKERSESPVAIAVAKRQESRHEKDQSPNVRMIWMRARLADGEQPSEETIKAMIAYMSDFQFIGTASRAVGLTRASSPRLGMLASLDHATHFYPLPKTFDPRAPLLHIMESPLVDVGAGRGVVRGLVYTIDGVLVATTVQEGVVRADLGKPERGLVEGGAVDDLEKVKAKL